MAKKRRQHSANRGDVFWLERLMVDAPVWRGLTNTAKIVYMDFLLKRQMNPDDTGMYYIANNGNIQYTYNEAKNKGIPYASFQRAIDELIEKGFLSVTNTGMGMYKGCTTYSIDDRWKLYGKPEFKIRKRPKQKRWNKQVGFQKGHVPHNKKDVSDEALLDQLADVADENGEILTLIDDNTSTLIDDNTSTKYYHS